MSLLPLSLIRYLIVCRVNAPLVRFYLFPSVELSLVLGTVIEESLPTVQSRPWRKALAPWKSEGGLSIIQNKNRRNVPLAAWPVESVLFCYPGKRYYGKGELILLELKLIGNSADHAFFLDVILPALETASRTIDKDWQPANSLWGNFDIQSVYVARGHVWESLVDNGRLNLTYMATPSQWAEGLTLDPDPQRVFHDVTWITPFDLEGPSIPDRAIPSKRISPAQVPSLRQILVALLERMNSLPTGTRNPRVRFWDMVEKDVRDSFDQLLESASNIPIIHGSFRPVPASQPGRWIGRQTFGAIPNPITPYLALASIFHIGALTHSGCGTFFIF